MTATAPDWFALVPGPLVLFEGDRVVAVTPTAEAELSRPADEMLGRGFCNLLLDDDADLLRALLAEMSAGGGSPDLGEDRFLVVRTRTGPYADFVELRLRRLADGRVAAQAIDASQEHRLDAVLAHLASSTFVVDESGAMIWRPLGNARRLGITDEDALGAPTLEWVHPEDLPELLRLFAEVVAEPGALRTALLRTRQPYVEDGWTVSRITGRNAIDDPAVRGVIVRSEEQSDVEVLASVGRTEGRFQSLAEAAPIGIVVTDRAGRVVYRNEHARVLLDQEDTAGSGPDAEWFHRARDDHRSDLRDMLDAAISGQRRGSLVVPFDHGQSVTWLSIDAVPQTDEAGRPFGIIASIRDVTDETEAREELGRTQAQLWHLANHDQLTGLPNRALFTDRLEGAMARERRDHHGVALLYCDLDGFKAVNDRHGHTVGDAVLVDVARRIESAVREADTVCRFGGDEFLVLCETFDDDAELESLARRILEAIHPLGGSDPPLGISIGLAVAGEGDTGGVLLARADNAMYRAKAHGKGRYALAPRDSRISQSADPRPS